MQIIVLSLSVADDRFSWRFIYKNILFFMIWQGSLKVYPRVLFGQNFAIRTVSTETVINRVFFFSWQSANWMETSLVWVPYNKLLNKLAFSRCSKKYWPSGLSTKIYYSLLYGSHDRNKSLVRSKYLFVLSHWSGTDLHVKFKTYYRNILIHSLFVPGKKSFTFEWRFKYLFALNNKPEEILTLNIGLNFRHLTF